MESFNFQSQNLVVDWISFNIQGLTDPQIIASGLSKHFTPHILINGEPYVSYHGLKKKYKVSIRQSTGFKGYWVGTQIIFSGKDADHCYNLIKMQEFDWNIFLMDHPTLSLGRIDLCFCRTNGPNDTMKSFDEFLVDSRSQVQNHTTTRYIRLQDFPDGKLLKVNRRNNSLHYRVYQKDQGVRFELEFKHRQTQLVQDYLFNNHLDVFEHKLVLQYFKYSGQVLRLDYQYADWVIDFRRKYRPVNTSNRALLTSYLENRVMAEEEEERLFHLLQFLSFIKSLELNSLKDRKRLRVKKQNYYSLKFPLSKFVKYTGIQISNQSSRKKLIGYFKQLHKLDPIVKEFSDGAFRSYVCFLYVECENPSGKAWVVEVFAAEELFWFPYPFQLPKSFLISRQKNDLRLKVRLMKSLAVNEQKKVLDLQEFFCTINVSNKHLIGVKESIVRLLKELVKDKIIHNQLEILSKSGKKKEVLIKFLTASDITRRIKYLKFTENIKNKI
jgi:hypothetical protein